MYYVRIVLVTCRHLTVSVYAISHPFLSSCDACRENGLHPGIPFWVGGIVGALLPELLHRTLLTTEEIKEHSKAA
jgi:hypothetical protein